MSDITNINSEAFDRCVSLRDAYRIMVQFLRDLNARGTVDTEWILYAYAGLMDNGETSDPAALLDFLVAASAVEES